MYSKHIFYTFFPLVVAGERPYKCTECQKAFTQKNTLIIHMKKHSGEKNYECEHCGTSFVQKGNLKTHIKRVHEKATSAVGSISLPKEITHAALQHVGKSLQQHTDERNIIMINAGIAAAGNTVTSQGSTLVTVSADGTVAGHQGAIMTLAGDGDQNLGVVMVDPSAATGQHAQAAQVAQEMEGTTAASDLVLINNLEEWS